MIILQCASRGECECTCAMSYPSLPELPIESRFTHACLNPPHVFRGSFSRSMSHFQPVAPGKVPAAKGARSARRGAAYGNSLKNPGKHALAHTTLHGKQKRPCRRHCLPCGQLAFALRPLAQDPLGALARVCEKSPIGST